MTELLINAEWVPAQGTTVHDLIDPTSRRLLAPIRSASRSQRDQALEAARVAHESWSCRPIAARTAIVAEAINEIRQAAAALAERQAIETGQPVRECQDLVASALRRLRLPAQHDPESIIPRRLRLSRGTLWPFWERVLRAITAGATLVCELPLDRAFTALAIAHCANRIPAGVLNVVTIEVEASMTPRPEAATDFVFVGQDANIDVAVPGAAALRLYNTGQRGGQSARIFVAAPVAQRFTDRLHEYLAFLEAGDPRKPITDLGPLSTEAVLEQTLGQIGSALKRGALVKLGGRQYQPWGLTGYFLQPTLLVEGTGAERIPHELICGPVVIVSPTIDVGAALRKSAGVAHGPLRLAAFTGQPEKLERSLQLASLEPRIRDLSPLVDRAWNREEAAVAATQTVDVELIEAAQSDWFPYANRRGMRF